MVWVASEGDGNGIASAPVNLFHVVKVLWSRGEKGNPACKDKVFNQWHGVCHSAVSSLPSSALSQPSRSLATREPIGHHRQTVYELRLRSDSFMYCLKHMLILCATKLEK